MGVNDSDDVPVHDVTSSKTDKYTDEFRESACKLLEGEMQQFQELLDSFATGQRKRMEMHLCQVQQLLASVPERVQIALQETLRDGKVSRGASGSGPYHVTELSSMASASSWLQHPMSDSALTVQQEYRDMKKLRSRSRVSNWVGAQETLERVCLSCPCTPRYYFSCARLRGFVHGHNFGRVALAIIFLNVVFTVIVSDTEVRMHALDQGQKLPEWFTTADRVFFVLFAVELVFRLVADEVFFFVGEHWKWNMLDTVVVVAAGVDTLSAASAPNLGFVRIIRMLRVVRSVKVMRIIRYFHELRVMVLQIKNSLKPMIWAFLFLGLVILMFALVFTQGVIGYFEDLEAGRIVVSQAEEEDLRRLCGSFVMSLVSLFMAISGGINWANIALPLMQVSPIYVCLFLLYILVLMIGVLNIIVGIFVDSATNAAAKDREALALEEMQKNEAFLRGLEELFNDMDADRVGTITWERFEEFARRGEIRARFATLELDVSHAQEVFKLIDMNDKGFIGVDEFVVGIMRSKGLAKRTDIHSLMYQISQVLKNWHKHRNWTAERLDRIDAHLMDFRSLAVVV